MLQTNTTMPLFLTRNQREDSARSAEACISKFSTPKRFRSDENKPSVIKGSFQTWYRKRKETSPSPPPPLRQDSLSSESTTTDSSSASTESSHQGTNVSRSTHQSH